MRRFLLWLLMVALFVALILGGTGYALYRMTDEDKLPQTHPALNDAALTPNGWDWQVPVLGAYLQRSFSSPANLTVQDLGSFSAAPVLTLPDWATAAEVTITAPDGTTWRGDKSTLNDYAYAQNGQYGLTLTVRCTEADPPSDPTGWYSYRARFTVNVPPQVTLSSERAAQGAVVAIEVTGRLDGTPSLETDLGTVWFRTTDSGFMGYIPVTYNAESGAHTLTLTCGSLTQELTLTVLQASTVTVVTEADESEGGAEFQNAIWPLYTSSADEKLWEGKFQAPCSGSVTVQYGAVRMVDGARDGRATAATYQCEENGEVRAPQNGVVVYAGALQLTGGTVVIDHGCGVKSYLYGLEEITVSVGDELTGGMAVGSAGEDGLMDYELRIGSKTVDPEQAISGSGGLQYHEDS